MCRFIESIQLSDGKLHRLELHQARVNCVFADHFPNKIPFNLNELFCQQDLPQKGLYKCRIVFDNQIHTVEILPYSRREIRSLKLVDADIDSHPYKPEDRSKLNEAYTKRGDCDDILIVKNGYLTDSWYANIALWNGESWFTPAKPLIYGVQRAALLEVGKIKEKDILATELNEYQSICLFNAMIEFGELELSVNDIR